MTNYQPIIDALAALIVAATPVLVLILRSDVKEVHAIVNAQHTQLVGEVQVLKAQLALLTSQQPRTIRSTDAPRLEAPP